MSASALLRCRGLEAGYGTSRVLFGLDFDIRAGEVVALLGRNGMGKSTTIRTIVGGLRPQRGEIVFEGRPIHAERADAIAPSPHPIDGIAVDEIRARAASATSRVRARDLRPLAPACRWTTIELARPDERAVHGTARCEVETPGTCAGLGVWFEAELAGGARFTSGPSTGTTVYDCAWFPLPRPLDVVAGDRLEIKLRAVSDGQEFVWRWEVVREPASGGPAESVQGTDLAARMIGASRRGRRAAAHVPARDAAVEELAALASLVDGARPLAGIAEALRRRFPSRWPTEAEALAWTSRELARLVEGGA